MKRISKKAAISDAERDIREEHERKRDFYKKLYGKSKKYAFPPKDKINLEKHFYFPKSVVTEYNLSMRALAVYPVMCLKADFEDDKWFKIPQDEIAVKSGLSRNTVQKAILELEENDLIKRKIENSGKRHYYVYKVEFIRKDMIEEYKNEYFTFNQSIVDSATWADLNLRSRALYLAFRVKAFFDIEVIFYEDEVLENPLIDYDHYIGMNLAAHRNRKFDMCTTPISQLCKLVGIDSSNLTQVLEQLEKHGLIKRFGDWFEVYLKPIISE
jgi:DNA-binding MarR family transcriptional regulator